MQLICWLIKPSGTGSKALGADFPTSSRRKCSCSSAAIDGSCMWFCCLGTVMVILKDAKGEKVYRSVAEWWNGGMGVGSGGSFLTFHFVIYFYKWGAWGFFSFFFFPFGSQQCSQEIKTAVKGLKMIWKSRH